MGQITNPSGISKPGGASTNVQYNNAGTLAGDSGFTYTTGTRTITLGDATAMGTITVPPRIGSNPGFDLNVISGAGNLAGSGGALTLSSGNAGATGASGGSVFLLSGNGGTIGNGGNITLAAGNSGTASGVAGGQVTIFTGDGNSTGSSSGGNFRVQCGQGSGLAGGGALQLFAGASVGTAAGSACFFQGGDANTGIGGAVTFSPGLGADNAHVGSCIFLSTVDQLATLQVTGDSYVVLGTDFGTANGGGGALVAGGNYRPAVAPVSGGTFTVPDRTGFAVFVPAALLATHTFLFPSNPLDGMILEICFVNFGVTAATWPANVLGGPATISANSGLSWRWSTSLAKWLRRF